MTRPDPKTLFTHAVVAGLLLVLGACSTRQARPERQATPATTGMQSTSSVQPASTSSAFPAAVLPSPAEGAQLPAHQLGATLADAIDAFIAQPRFRHAEWGIDVVDLASGQVRYSHQAQKLFVPASNTKLYTAALALDTLGPEARFATTLLTTATSLQGSVLRGDLILKGGGDPSLGDPRVSPLTAQWADDMAAELSRRGITRVAGDLVGDDTYFSGPAFGNGWEADDLQSTYAPPVSALSSDGNAMAVIARRDKRGCCKIEVQPQALADDIVNLTRKSAAIEGNHLVIARINGSDKLWISGGLPDERSVQRIAQSVPDPARLAALQLRHALSHHGITVQGRVRVVHWPQDGAGSRSQRTTVLMRTSSPPLSQLVQHMLKKSDNFYAQTLLLQVGKKVARTGSCPDRARTPATSEQWGLCAMRAMLHRIGLSGDQASFSEGSGLSRRNLVSPEATTSLLVWIQRQPFARLLVDALPIAGVDGTLKHRMNNTPAEGNLRAKTGTLTHAYALAGYVTDARDRRLAFAITLDRYQRPRDSMGRRLPPSPSQELDALAVMLASAGRVSEEPLAP